MHLRQSSLILKFRCYIGQGRAQGGCDVGGRRPLFEMLTYNFLLKIAFYSEKIVL